jgi:oxygen-independent coproporphyrinogen-3 oxidase
MVLPVGDEKSARFMTLVERRWSQLVIVKIGMDLFALESESLWKAATGGTLHRNFMGYTPRFVAPLIGLGVSAISDAWDAFAQNGEVHSRFTKSASQR